MNKSEEINEIAGAIAKMQGEISAAPKMKTNPFFKSKYADLAGIWDCCRESLAKNGLSVIQMPEDNEKGFSLTTMIMHSSGQWISSEYNMPVMKADPQALGSAITYARRYALSAMLGIVADDDDDGNAAMNKQPSNVKPIKKQEPEFYPQDKFESNKQKWKDMVESGERDQDYVIAFLNSKGGASPEQMKEIKTWGIKE